MAVLAFANPSPPSALAPSFPSGCKAITAGADTFERPVAVYVGVAGTVVFTPANGEAACTLTMVAGSFVPCLVTSVTGGTASGLFAVY